MFSKTKYPRCSECAFLGSKDNQDVCYRNYPPIPNFMPDCKMRLYNNGPWISAFIKRHSWLMELDELFGKEIIDMSTATLDEKKARAKQFLSKYAKSTLEKGSSVVADFAEKLPEQFQSFQRMNLGIPSIDSFFGGGLPLGGLITLFGDTSVGKTSLCLAITSAAQKAGKLVLYCDAEGTLDMSWARTLGVDTANMVYIGSDVPPDENFTPATLEDYLNAIVSSMNDNIFDLAVIDSLDAMMARGRVQSKKGKKRDLDDDDIALKARKLSDFYPRIIGSLRAGSHGLIQIGQMRATGIGSAFVTQTMSGGNARKFYDLLTLRLSRGDKASAPMDGDTPVGYGLNIRATKSKISGIKEGQTTSTAFFFGTGFDPVYEMVLAAMANGAIAKKSAASVELTTVDGRVIPIRYGKEYRIANYIKENNLVDDLRAVATGELTPDVEAALGEGEE